MDAIPEETSTLGRTTSLIGAMGRFCAEHTHFESSIAGERVLDELAAATDVNHAALVPLRHKIFDFDTALRWGFFLSQALPHLALDGPRMIGGPNLDFDVGLYHNSLASVYDLAVQNAVWDLCEPGESEPSEEDASSR
jgi:hypothetical protein